MTTPVDLKGNTLQVDDVETIAGVSLSDINTTVTDLHIPTFASAVANPGTGATTIGFDKVLKITISGTDYYIGLLTANT